MLDDELEKVCVTWVAEIAENYERIQTETRQLRDLGVYIKSKSGTWQVLPALIIWKRILESMARKLRRLLSPRHLYQQIQQLKEQYPVRVRYEVPCICVDLGTVCLGGYELGQFSVEFYHGSVCGLTADIVHTGQLAPGMRADIPHPHILGSTFCAGADNETFSRLLEMGELVEYVSLLEQLLHTYNPDMAYIKLGDAYDRKQSTTANIHV